jgi:hypothetical protein
VAASYSNQAIFVKNSKFGTVKRMALDLETIRGEIQDYLERSGMAIFYGYHRMLDSLAQVAWDTASHPDFREFLDVAKNAGSKIVVFNHQAFSLDQIDEALDSLEDTNFSRDERRAYETRLRQLQAYEGFTCLLELSFQAEGRTYLFELHTDWYESLNQIVEEIDASIEEQEEDTDGDSLGGYFSKN